MEPNISDVMLMRNLLPDLFGLDEVSFFMAEVIGFIGVAVMVYGCTNAAYRYVTCMMLHKVEELPYIRIILGKHLSLGLEFLVGKDIIESIVRPSWDDLGKLAAIIALRTAVTFMLSWELKELKEEIRQDTTRSKRKK